MNFIIPPWVKWAVLAAIMAALVAGGYYIKSIMAQNVELRNQQTAMLDRIDKAEKANARQDAVFVKRDELQNTERNNVADVTVRIKQEAANDPPTRSFLTSTLPGGLRRAILQADAARAAAEHPSVDSANADRGVIQVKRGVSKRPGK